MDNRVLSVRVPRPAYRRLQKLATEAGKGFNKYVRHVIWEATEGVQLTPEDYAIIKKEMEADIEKEIAKGRRTKG